MKNSSPITVVVELRNLRRAIKCSNNSCKEDIIRAFDQLRNIVECKIKEGKLIVYEVKSINKKMYSLMTEFLRHIREYEKGFHQKIVPETEILPDLKNELETGMYKYLKNSPKQSNTSELGLKPCTIITPMEIESYLANYTHMHEFAQNYLHEINNPGVLEIADSTIKGIPSSVSFPNNEYIYSAKNEIEAEENDRNFDQNEDEVLAIESSNKDDNLFKKYLRLLAQWFCCYR